MLATNNGLPGIGKTEYTTYLALKHFHRENNLIRRTIRIIKKRESLVNNIYSDYPILLDKKNHIYSRIIHIDDLDNTYSLLPNSFIAIDEPQIDYDAFDYSIFPRGIGMFLQAHRHFGISNIVFSTQHPNRLVMYEKNIMSVYIRILSSFKIPFTPFKFLILRQCYELVNYDSITTRNKTEKQLKDIKTKLKIINAGKVHKHYNDRYLAPINIDKPLLDKGCYSSLELTGNQLNAYKKKFEDNNVKNFQEVGIGKRKKKKNKISYSDTGRNKKSDTNYDIFLNL